MATSRRADKFPLWRHKGTGLWCKKHRGEFHYFGADKAAAHKRYLAEWGDILEGRAPRGPAARLTVADLVNRFLNWKRDRVATGELTPQAWGQYYAMAARVVETFRRSELVSRLRPDDFGRLRARAAKRLGPNTLGVFIVRARSMFKYAFTAGLVDVPIRYGDQFDPPTRRVMRLHRHDKGAKLIPAADIRKLLELADVQTRAMILLGINAGYGAKDCSDLQRAALKACPGWIEAPRRKTGTSRRSPLWPETIAALAAVEKVRPAPKDPADAGCVFVTSHGNRWWRYIDRGEKKRGLSVDSIANAFTRLARAAGVKVVGSFYTLRHTFRTVADEVKDQPAAMLIMGHIDQTISGHYRQAITDDRLEAIASHVRAWLFPRRKPRTK